MSEKKLEGNNAAETQEAAEKTGKYMCPVCKYVYDPAVGDPDRGVPAGTAFEDLPDGWRCPKCAWTRTKFTAL